MLVFPSFSFFISFYCCLSLSPLSPAFALLCRWGRRLSRVLDEDFYKQPFSELIGYVYVAPTNILPLHPPFALVFPIVIVPHHPTSDIKSISVVVGHVLRFVSMRRCLCSCLLSDDFISVIDTIIMQLAVVVFLAKSKTSGLIFTLFIWLHVINEWMLVGMFEWREWTACHSAPIHEISHRLWPLFLCARFDPTPFHFPLHYFQSL